MTRQKKIDIILYSLPLKNKLKKRLAELNLKSSDVVRIAREEGMTSISKEKLSRYLNSPIPIHGYPTQADILWLANRFGIDIKLHVKLSPFDEEQSKRRAQEILNVIKF